MLSQVLTLFTTPVIYLYFDRMGRRWGRKPDADARLEQADA
jgi:multidrug efflux pump